MEEIIIQSGYFGVLKPAKRSLKLSNRNKGLDDFENESSKMSMSGKVSTHITSLQSPLTERNTLVYISFVPFSEFSKFVCGSTIPSGFCALQTEFSTSTLSFKLGLPQGNRTSALHLCLKLKNLVQKHSFAASIKLIVQREDTIPKRQRKFLPFSFTSNRHRYAVNPITAVTSPSNNALLFARTSDSVPLTPEPFAPNGETSFFCQVPDPNHHKWLAAFYSVELPLIRGMVERITNDPFFMEVNTQPTFRQILDEVKSKPYVILGMPNWWGFQICTLIKPRAPRQKLREKLGYVGTATLSLNLDSTPVKWVVMRGWPKNQQLKKKRTKQSLYQEFVSTDNLDDMLMAARRAGLQFSEKIHGIQFVFEHYDETNRNDQGPVSLFKISNNSSSKSGDSKEEKNSFKKSLKSSQLVITDLKYSTSGYSNKSVEEGITQMFLSKQLSILSFHTSTNSHRDSGVYEAEAEHASPTFKFTEREASKASLTTLSGWLEDQGVLLAMMNSCCNSTEGSYAQDSARRAIVAFIQKISPLLRKNGVGQSFESAGVELTTFNPKLTVMWRSLIQVVETKKFNCTEELFVMISTLINADEIREDFLKRGLVNILRQIFLSMRDNTQLAATPCTTPIDKTINGDPDPATWAFLEPPEEVWTYTLRGDSRMYSSSFRNLKGKPSRSFTSDQGNPKNGLIKGYEVVRKKLLLNINSEIKEESASNKNVMVKQDSDCSFLSSNSPRNSDACSEATSSNLQTSAPVLSSNFNLMKDPNALSPPKFNASQQLTESSLAFPSNSTTQNSFFNAKKDPNTLSPPRFNSRKMTPSIKLTSLAEGSPSPSSARSNVSTFVKSKGHTFSLKLLEHKTSLEGFDVGQEGVQTSSLVKFAPQRRVIRDTSMSQMALTTKVRAMQAVTDRFSQMRMLPKPTSPHGASVGRPAVPMLHLASHDYGDMHATTSNNQQRLFPSARPEMTSRFGRRNPFLIIGTPGENHSICAETRVKVESLDLLARSLGLGYAAADLWAMTAAKRSSSAKRTERFESLSENEEPGIPKGHATSTRAIDRNVSVKLLLGHTSKYSLLTNQKKNDLFGAFVSSIIADDHELEKLSTSLPLAQQESGPRAALLKLMVDVRGFHPKELHGMLFEAVMIEMVVNYLSSSALSCVRELRNFSRPTHLFINQRTQRIKPMTAEQLLDIELNKHDENTATTVLLEASSLVWKNLTEFETHTEELQYSRSRQRASISQRRLWVRDMCACVLIKTTILEFLSENFMKLGERLPIHVLCQMVENCTDAISGLPFKVNNGHSGDFSRKENSQKFNLFCGVMDRMLLVLTKTLRTLAARECTADKNEGSRPIFIQYLSSEFFWANMCAYLSWLLLDNCMETSHQSPHHSTVTRFDHRLEESSSPHPPNLSMSSIASLDSETEDCLGSQINLPPSACTLNGLRNNALKCVCIITNLCLKFLRRGKKKDSGVDPAVSVIHWLVPLFSARTGPVLKFLKEHQFDFVSEEVHSCNLFSATGLVMQPPKRLTSNDRVFMEREGTVATTLRLLGLLTHMFSLSKLANEQAAMQSHIYVPFHYSSFLRLYPHKTMLKQLLAKCHITALIAIASNRDHSDEASWAFRTLQVAHFMNQEISAEQRFPRSKDAVDMHTTKSAQESSSKNDKQNNSSALPVLKIGDTVDAYCEVKNGKKRWFPGKVLQVAEQQASCLVAFFDGQEKNIARQDLRISKRRSPRISVCSSLSDQSGTPETGQSINAEQDALPFDWGTSQRNHSLPIGAPVLIRPEPPGGQPDPSMLRAMNARRRQRKRMHTQEKEEPLRKMDLEKLGFDKESIEEGVFDIPSVFVSCKARKLLGIGVEEPKETGFTVSKFLSLNLGMLKTSHQPASNPEPTIGFTKGRPSVPGTHISKVPSPQGRKSSKLGPKTPCIVALPLSGPIECKEAAEIPAPLTINRRCSLVASFELGCTQTAPEKEKDNSLMNPTPSRLELQEGISDRSATKLYDQTMPKTIPAQMESRRVNNSESAPKIIHQTKQAIHMGFAVKLPARPEPQKSFLTEAHPSDRTRRTDRRTTREDSNRSATYSYDRTAPKNIPAKMEPFEANKHDSAPTKYSQDKHACNMSLAGKLPVRPELEKTAVTEAHSSDITRVTGRRKAREDSNKSDSKLNDRIAPRTIPARMGSLQANDAESAPKVNAQPKKLINMGLAMKLPTRLETEKAGAAEAHSNRTKATARRTTEDDSNRSFSKLNDQTAPNTILARVESLQTEDVEHASKIKHHTTSMGLPVKLVTRLEPEEPVATVADCSEKITSPSMRTTVADFEALECPSSEDILSRSLSADSDESFLAIPSVLPLKSSRRDTLLLPKETTAPQFSELRNRTLRKLALSSSSSPSSDDDASDNDFLDIPPVIQGEVGHRAAGSNINQQIGLQNPMTPLNLCIDRKKSLANEPQIKSPSPNCKGKKPLIRHLTFNTADISTTNRSDQSSSRNSPSSQLKKYKMERSMIPLYADPEIHELVVYLLIRLALTADCRNIESAYTSHINPQQQSENDGAAGFNLLFTLHHHLNHPYNAQLLPGLAARLKAGGHQTYLLFKLLCGATFDEASYFSGGEKKIASGAFGCVVSVKCPLPLKNGKKGYLAVKSMERESGPFDRSIASNLFVELSALSALRDVPQVCKLYDFGVSRDRLHLVMERCVMTLKEWRLKKPGHISEQDLVLYLQIYSQLLTGVAAIADKGIAHFDIKCDNILLRNNPDDGVYKETVAIADFGEAHMGPSSWQFEEDLSEDPETEPFVHFVNSSMMRARGTECIQSPEMLQVAKLAKENPDKFARRGAISIGLASDIWSVGCLLYELMTGTWLFEFEDWSEFYFTITADRVALPPKNRMAPLSHLTASSQIEQLLSYILVRVPHLRPRAVDIKQKISVILGSMCAEVAILTKEKSSDLENATNDMDEEQECFELCRYPTVNCWLASRYDTFMPLAQLYLTSNKTIMEMMRDCHKDEDPFDTLSEVQKQVVMNAQDLLTVGITHIANFQEQKILPLSRPMHSKSSSCKKLQRCRTVSSLCPSNDNILNIRVSCTPSNEVVGISAAIGEALSFLKKHHSQRNNRILLVGGEMASCALLAYVMFFKNIEMYEAVLFIRNTYPGFWISKSFIRQLQMLMSDRTQTSPFWKE